MLEDNEEHQIKSEEDILKKQRKEKKELQAQLQKIKHAVPKGDKKRKKDVQIQVAQMEAELDQKHDDEIKSFQAVEINNLSTQVNAIVGTCEHEDKKKLSKAQKRREKKAQKEKEVDERIKQSEVDNLLGARHQEALMLKQLLGGRNLSIHEIPSDGNCLYSAIRDQLMRVSVQSSVESLRKQTAEYLRQHTDDFMPFMTNPTSGDCYTLEGYEKYCSEVESTTAWGGQLEIKALSNILQRPIEIVQADGPHLVIGEEQPDSILILSYHRHMYGLGEHYNSVVEKNRDDVEGEDGGEFG